MNYIRRMIVIILAMLIIGLTLLYAAVGVVEVLPTGPASIFAETDLVRAGRPACVIVAPTEERWTDGATEVALALREAYSMEFPIIPHAEVCPERLGPVEPRFRDRNLILAGNAHTTRAMLGLCAGFRLGVASYYPGGDGYVLRSVCNHWRTGRSAFVVGGTPISVVLKPRGCERC